MTPYLQQHNAVLQRLQALPVGSFSQFIAITVRTHAASTCAPVPVVDCLISLVAFDCSTTSQVLVF